MTNIKSSLTTVGGMLILFLLLTTPATVSASNGQNPNRQITSSNTSADNLSWVRMSMLANEPYHFSASNNNFSFQMNTLLNGGSNSCDCAFTWWLQGVVEVTNSHSGTKGAFVGDAFNEVWNGANDHNFCYFYPSSPPNINFTGYDVLQQTTLNTTSKITYHMSVATGGGSNLYTNTQTCLYPSGYGSVSYFTQEEGVIVGDWSGNHVTFKPLDSTIMYGYIDMVSNHNSMSSSSLTIQTLESSNLYQDVTSHFGESYGSMYLYTVESNENTTAAI
jgi:hypothetical protein